MTLACIEFLKNSTNKRIRVNNLIIRISQTHIIPNGAHWGENEHELEKYLPMCHISWTIVCRKTILNYSGMTKYCVLSGSGLKYALY